jgi:hypothetical protein
MKIKSLAVSALPMLAMFAVGFAQASTVRDPTVSASSTINDSIVTINGQLNDTDTGVTPWVIQVFAAAGDCVRLNVSTTNFDSEIVTTAPGGAVYRDDDSGGSLRPLVMIDPAPFTGWYTVQVAHWAGSPINADFTLKYGRYTSGNANCSSPTTPLGGFEPASTKAR